MDVSQGKRLHGYKVKLISALSRFKSSFYVIIILAVGFSAFYPTLGNEFTNLDDPLYVTDNKAIQDVSFTGLKQIFTSSSVGNYQPLTILSYAVEYNFFKNDPWIYHLNNMILHFINTILVFLLLVLISKRLSVAFMVALLFCIHPQHVESVAWISARKDVLYSFFFLGALIGYVLYLKRKTPILYYPVVVLLTLLSILSKGQAVILPLIFILFDYFLYRRFSYKVVIDKIPFFLMAIGFGITAVYFQESSDAVQDYAYFTFLERIFFSCYAFVGYFIKFLIPANLSCFYAYPETNGNINSVWVYFTPFIILIGFSLVYRYGRKIRDLVFGLLFFTISILPVIQLIPVGDAIMADRYTYISYIGLFYLLAWGVHKLIQQLSQFYNQTGPVLTILIIGYFSLLWFLTNERVKVWKDSISLFNDAISKDPNVPITHANRGVAYFAMDKYQEAIVDFTKVLEINENFPMAYRNRALAYKKTGNIELAVDDFSNAIKRNPGFIENYKNRAELNKKLNRKDLVIDDYNIILELDPNDIVIRYYRGDLYGRSGKYKLALADFNAIIELNPKFWQAHNNRGVVNNYLGRYKNAVKDFTEAIRLNPKDGSIYLNRSLAYNTLRAHKPAYNDALKARELGQNVTDEYINNLKKVLESSKTIRLNM